MCKVPSAPGRTVYINLEAMQPPNPAFKQQYLGRAEEWLPQVLRVGSATPISRL